jgi:PPK2 family polyphosphate:nucleotide phosphotransferase
MPDAKTPKGDRLGDLLRVRPGSTVDLSKIDPSNTFGHSKDSAETELARGLERLESLQERLWATKGGQILIVLQGIDTAGKDGTVRHVMSAFNPQGCEVVGFVVPTPEEAAHDYLWRHHQHTPAAGWISIFNRSHYESVLVVRVHDLVPQSTWKRRYRQINDWERMLTEEGTTVLKFFLLIDSDEQRDRLQARLDTPDKRWKFSSADLRERQLWDQYIKAFEEALSRCSTEWAPWYVIPSNHKWFRNFAVAEILADTMDDLKLEYPAAEEGIEDLVVR